MCVSIHICLAVCHLFRKADILILYFRMVDDLHHLIHQMIGTSPILLVGVDYSAFIARFYAQVYEE